MIFKEENVGIAVQNYSRTYYRSNLYYYGHFVIFFGFFDIAENKLVDCMCAGHVDQCC